jgi:hypothetical protein
MSKQIKKNLTKPKTRKNKTRLVPRPLLLSAPSKVSYNNERSIARTMTSQLCAITDPFCNHAQAVRWPDGNGNGTIPVTFRSHQAITAFANGGALVYSNPTGFPYSLYTASSYSAGSYTVSTTGSSVSGPFDVYAAFSTFRVVSAGIIIRNLATVMNTSGYLIISRPTSLNVLGGSEVTGNSMLFKNITIPISPGMEIPLIHCPVGNESRNFIAFPAAATTNIVDAAWDGIRIELVGCGVSSIAIDIEFVYRLELVPKQVVGASAVTLLSQTAPATTKSQPLLTTAANTVRQSLTNTIHQSVDSFSKAAVRFAGNALLTYLAPEAKMLTSFAALTVD